MRVQVYPLYGETEEEGKTFFGGYKEGESAAWDYSQEQLVVIRDKNFSPVLKLEIIPPFLCYLLDTLTDKEEDRL